MKKSEKDSLILTLITLNTFPMMFFFSYIFEEEISLLQIISYIIFACFIISVSCMVYERVRQAYSKNDSDEDKKEDDIVSFKISDKIIFFTTAVILICSVINFIVLFIEKEKTSEKIAEVIAITCFIALIIWFANQMKKLLRKKFRRNYLYEHKQSIDRRNNNSRVKRGRRYR